MSALDIYDLVPAAPDDLRNTKYGSKRTQARPFDRVDVAAGPLKYLFKRSARAADEAHRYVFLNETRKQVIQKFFPAAPAAEVIYKKNFHAPAMVSEKVLSKSTPKLEDTTSDPSRRHRSRENRPRLCWISYNLTYFMNTAWASMTDIVKPAMPSAMPNRTK